MSPWVDCQYNGIPAASSGIQNTPAAIAGVSRLIRGSNARIAPPAPASQTPKAIQPPTGQARSSQADAAADTPRAASTQPCHAPLPAWRLDAAAAASTPSGTIAGAT